MSQFDGDSILLALRDEDKARIYVSNRIEEQYCSYCGSLAECKPFGENETLVCHKCAKNPSNNCRFHLAEMVRKGRYTGTYKAYNPLEKFE